MVGKDARPRCEVVIGASADFVADGGRLVEVGQEAVPRDADDVPAK